MSVFTKIFIVINLALTLGLTGIAGSLFAQRANHHYANYKLAHEAWRKVTEDLKRERDQGRDQAKALKEQTDKEESDAATETTRLAELTKQQAELDKENTDKSQAKNQFITQKQKGEKTNNDLNDDVKSLVGQRNQAENTRNEGVAGRNRANNNLREVEERIAAINAEIATIKKAQEVATGDIKELESLIAYAQNKGVPTVKITRDLEKQFGTKITGSVNRVEMGVFLMFLDLGDSDGLKEGMQFTVYRGDRYICNVKIKTVGDAESSAWVLVDTMVQGMRPQPKDLVKNYD